MLFLGIRALQRRLIGLEGSVLWRGALLATGVVAITVSILWVVRELANNAAWPTRTDMGLYLAAADAILQGGNPYTPSSDGFHRYPYPPLFADIMALLVAMFGTSGAAAIWTALDATALVAAVLLLTRGFGVRLSIPWTVFVFGILFLARSARSELYHGQLNFTLLFLLAFGFLCWRQGRTHLACATWAVMICFKPFVGVVALFLLGQRDWRAASLTVLLSGALFALSFLPAHQDIVGTFLSWRETTQHYASPVWAANPLNQSFYALLLRLFTENEFSRAWLHAPALVPLGLSILLAVALGVMWVVSRGDVKREGPLHALVRLSAFMAAFMSLGPVTEGGHLYFLFPGAIGAFALAWRRISDGDQRQGLWLATAIAWLAVVAVLLSSRAAPMNFANPATWDALHGAGILLSGWYALSLMTAGILSALVLEMERRATETARQPVHGSAAPRSREHAVRTH